MARSRCIEFGSLDFLEFGSLDLVGLTGVSNRGFRHSHRALQLQSLGLNPTGIVLWACLPSFLLIEPLIEPVSLSLVSHEGPVERTTHLMLGGGGWEAIYICWAGRFIVQFYWREVLTLLHDSEGEDPPINCRHVTPLYPPTHPYLAPTMTTNSRNIELRFPNLYGWNSHP